jgi:8-oxo-dGTP pyrophosphatase MutT (NUDIX family)
MPSSYARRSSTARAAMRIEVRGVILIGGRLLVHRERQLDGVHLSLPGGRVGPGEHVDEALHREVEEEIGIAISIGPLLYVAEVVSNRGLADLNLFFRVYPVDPAPTFPIGSCDLIDLDHPHAEFRPPILECLQVDADHGWIHQARWLGNLWDAASSPIANGDNG